MRNKWIDVVDRLLQIGGVVLVVALVVFVWWWVDQREHKTCCYAPSDERVNELLNRGFSPVDKGGPACVSKQLKKAEHFTCP